MIFGRSLGSSYVLGEPDHDYDARSVERSKDAYRLSLRRAPFRNLRNQTWRARPLIPRILIVERWLRTVALSSLDGLMPAKVRFP